MIIFYQIIWFIISLIEKSYWHIWRNIQKSRFAECGKKVWIGRHCCFTNSSIYIGDDVFIGQYASFIASVSSIRIGSHVMFGPHVTIRGGDHRFDVEGKFMSEVKDKLPENDKDVIICDDVWVGCNATILKGVTVGQGSIIGAGSIVTKDIPPYTIHVGTGASKDFSRFTDEQLLRHKEILARRK